MWKQINNNEKCKLLQKHTNDTYTIPSGMYMYYNPELRAESDVTYYFKASDIPLLETRKGWNDQGLWETTYWKWEESDGTSIE